ncbi:MAG TPA: hypothetical protein VFD92_10340 [Candidatus Binatia bacterium]|nr:hypothetical protein [Candidatus Binatia bacterium]
MSLARKAAIVHGGLLLLTLWPAFQMALVARWDVSPWKLAGWGMYSTPRFSLVGMEIDGRTAPGGEWRRLDDPSPELRAVAGRFLERHRWLRRLAASDELIARVALEKPAWREVRVAVSYPALDGATGMVVLRTDERTERIGPPSAERVSGERR